MAEQTHVLAAHLETHGELIADPDTPSEHLIATFPIAAFEDLWEPKGWVLVNRDGEPVETLADADPGAAPDEATAEADRAKLRKEQAAKFRRAKKSAAPSTTSKEG